MLNEKRLKILTALILTSLVLLSVITDKSPIDAMLSKPPRSTEQVHCAPFPSCLDVKRQREKLEKELK